MGDLRPFGGSFCPLPWWCYKNENHHRIGGKRRIPFPTPAEPLALARLYPRLELVSGTVTTGRQSVNPVKAVSTRDTASTEGPSRASSLAAIWSMPFEFRRRSEARARGKPSRVLVRGCKPPWTNEFMAAHDTSRISRNGRTRPRSVGVATSKASSSLSMSSAPFAFFALAPLSAVSEVDSLSRCASEAAYINQAARSKASY